MLYITEEDTYFLSGTYHRMQLHSSLHICTTYKSEVTFCRTLCDPMDCNLSGFSDHGTFQAKILEWVAIFLSSHFFSIDFLFSSLIANTAFKIFFILNYFNWRLITLQYCSGFCHTLTWISHGCTCVSHPEPSLHLPSHPVPQGLLNAPALSTLSHASNLD